MRLSLKERKFIFLATFSLPSSSSLLKVPTTTTTIHAVFKMAVWFFLHVMMLLRNFAIC